MWHHTVTIRVASWRIKTLHTTLPTEEMLRLIRIERVTGEEIRPGQQCKLSFRDDEMMVLLFRTDRAVATEDAQICRCFDFEGHGAAMATASVFDEHRSKRRETE